MKINDNLYDVLAFIGRVVLPALAVLYATLGEIWHLPYTKEIPLTITAFDLFLNTLLGISSNTYYKTIAEESVIVDENYEELG